MGDPVKGGAYTFKVKSGSVEEMRAPDWAAGLAPAYRFRVKTGTVAVIALGPGLQVSALRWDAETLEHGTETTLHAHVEHWDGNPLRFVVEHEQGGQWHHYASVPATVKDGEASGVLRVHHPILPPVGAEPPLAQIKKAQPASLRFFLEEGIVEAPQPGSVSNPAFHSKTIEHGDEVDLSVDAPGLDGRTVRFVVEHHVKGDEWKKVGEQTSTVSGGKATAAVEIKAEEQIQEPRYVREGGLLAVDAPGIADGRAVKFIVETEKDGQWQAQAPVTALVKSGKAEAPLKLPWGKCRFHAELVPELPEGNIRFHAELI